MSGPAPTQRTLDMVEAYQVGATLDEVADLYGVSMQRVHEAVQRHAPESMRPQGQTTFKSVGPPGHELYMVGKCKDCGIALGSYRPIARKICGECLRPAA